jgi:hypothetical protein
LADLLKQSLNFLKTKVDSYNGNTSIVVEISNISTLNDGDEFLESTSPIVLSIVNIEEDITAKTPDLYKKHIGQNPIIEKFKNPTQYFITSLLFTAYNKVQTNNKYLDGISKLEHVIRCFQEQKVFYVKGGIEVPPDTAGHTKLILDLESLKFNELNQLWSMLGNKYMPSVLYKMRIISIQNDNLDGDRVIEKFKIQLWDNDQNDLAGQIEETKFKP